MVRILLAVLALAGIAYGIFLVRIARQRGEFSLTGEGIVLGAVTNFFDTLGIRAVVGAPLAVRLPVRSLQIAVGVAVLVVAYLVKSLPLEALRWVIVVVVLHTGVVMLRSAQARPA